MSDRIDQEGRAAFVQTLPRKVTELRATLGTLVADPRSQRMRDELRRRLHALYTLTRSYNLPTLSEGLREGIAHLDAVRGASILTQRDLETLADLIATLPANAQRDLPEQPQLFQTRGRAAEARPAAGKQPAPDSKKAPSLPPMPKMASQKITQVGIPAQPGPPPPSAPQPVVPPHAAEAGASIRPARPPGHAAPLGVLVVGGAGVLQEVKRALPPEADVHGVRTLAEAVTAARDTAPDVIVAESASPADGLGLLAALRGDPLTDFLPLVLLVSPNDGVETEAARGQGATEVLSAPIEPGRLREAIDRAAQGVTQNSIPPQNFGDLTLEELTRALQEEIRRGILGAAGPRANNARIALGQGSEILAATWEAIARVRDVVEKRTRGKVRFEMPGSSLGIAGAHVLSIGGEDEVTGEEENATDDPLPQRIALVVDDDPGVVWFFAGLLREAGMAVTECTDANLALGEARRVHPDVVISDILMPGIDGFALCRAIRRDVSLRHTPVILLSWKEDLLVRMRELGAQAQGFLRKESRGEAILARVRAVLRPRVRMLRRLENLPAGSELRGRVERVGIFTLLASTARSLFNATLTITDSFSVTEMEVREGKLVSVVRTLQDGSLVRGETALLQVLGTSNARFSLQRAEHAVRGNVQGELGKLLAGASALITALEDSLSGAALLEVASIDIDAEAAAAYAGSLPEKMRALVQRIVSGESPRNIILRDGVAPQELEPMLVELARRGAVRSVRGPDDEDLVAPRYAASQYGESLPPGSVPPKDSGTMPAVLKVPDAPGLPKDLLPLTSDETPGNLESPATPGASTRPPSLPKSQPPSASSSTPPATSGWTPPTNFDEASQPGFGIEGEKDSLAQAVLRELSEPVVESGDETEVDASDTVESRRDDDTPEFEEETTEAELSHDEIAKAAQSAPGLPLEGVELDARGLPRRKTSVPDLPEIKGAVFDPHEPAKRDESPSSSIIIDEAAMGAAAEPAAPRPRDTSPPPPKRPPPRAPEPRTSNPLWLLLGIVALGLLSYVAVRLVLGSGSTNHAAGADAAVSEIVADAGVVERPAPVNVPTSNGPDAASTSDVVADTAALDATGATASPAIPSADAGMVYEDPAPFLDGGTLPNGRGLLVIESPAHEDAEIAVDQHLLPRGVRTTPLGPGVHTVRYRTNAVVLFRFVPIQAGRASRVALSAEQ